MKTEKKSIVLFILMLAIFMGAIDSGIVSPAREIIQNSLGTGATTGIWMITIYTLFYAISMPIVSKLADRNGHKRVFVIGVGLFGLGSLLCGLSNFYSSFAWLLAARVIQAIGAGGIIPIATTYIGQSFPEEKRGTALGMVGAVFGVATIVGPSLGSGILGLAGNNHWGWIFFINVPISLIIIIFSIYMQNIQVKKKQAMDLVGALTIAAVIASLLYGLTNLDFFQLGSSLQDRKVYPFLLAFILLMPILITVEKRAVDPVLHIKYFKNQKMILIFIIAFITGVGLMGTVFIPQFAENVLKIKAGTGGYLITLLAVFSGVSAPISGRLLDKKGAPLVLTVGFTSILAGSLVLGYIAVSTLSFVSVMAGLALVGFGIGFTMGAPLNYLVLQSVPEDEGATAMATMSLIRSIGTTMSPGIMIGFIAQAAQNIQPRLMGLVQQNMNASTPGGMPLNTGSQADAARVFSTLKSADVTTIVDRLKAAMQQLVPDQMAPVIMQSIENMQVSIENVFQSTLNQGYTHMFVASAIIAGVGFALTLLLGRSIKSNKLEP
ncbi:MAG TPA: MFS transporter [Syntrophomonadaceae bacterium]|nr:MFS transporter [Syntrophomonadaceae bacterium]